MSPQRIQLRRTKGWRKPEGVVVVSRPSKWGNPTRALRTGNPDCIDQGAWYVDDGVGVEFFSTRRAANEYAVAIYESDVLRGDGPITADDVRGALAGRDLACWCPLFQPCHADVLLRLANTDTP